MARPILDIHCIMEPGCKYPVAVKLLMDDKTVQTYNLGCKHELQFQKVMDSVNISIGYQYEPEPNRRNRKRKIRIHRWHDEPG